MVEWRIERLGHGHLREHFDCGKPSLNDFLRALVNQYERRGLGRTYVALAVSNQRVFGYCTLGVCPMKRAEHLQELVGTPIALGATE